MLSRSETILMTSVDTPSWMQSADDGSVAGGMGYKQNNFPLSNLSTLCFAPALCKQAVLWAGVCKARPSQLLWDSGRDSTTAHTPMLAAQKPPDGRGRLAAGGPKPLLLGTSRPVS